MSLSKKVFSIIFLLLVVAAVILGASIYSLTTIERSVGLLISQANRLNDLNNVDKLVLQRRITTTGIVSELDEAAMRQMIDTDMRQLETAMADRLKSYESNFDNPPTANQREYLANIQRLWADYVAVTNDVVDLSYQNTNEKASRLHLGMGDFWEEADAELNSIADTLEQGDEKIRGYLRTALNLRTMVMRYRVLMLRYIPEHDRAVSDGYLKEIETVLNTTREALTEIAANLPEGGGGRRAIALADKVKQEQDTRIKEIISLVQQDTNVRASALLAEKGVPARGALVAYTGNVIASGTQFMDNAVREVVSLGETMLVTMVAVGAIGISLALIIAFFTVRAIVRGLDNIIASLNDSSSQVNAAAGQISSSSQELAEGSTEQAASLEQTSSALEQMASMTRQNADNANKTNDTTQNNNRLIGAGSEAVKNMSSAMAEISDSAEQINRIIKTIEDIAFQTNLLALNAAVEAARAGEAGKGFAVVADEVRNLAGRSAQAARDTTQLIHTTIDRVKNGSEIAQNLTSSFAEIEEGSHTVARLINEITSATNEQAQGVDQVNTAVAQMDKVTQSNAATAEEAASAAEELSAQASALNGMVDDLVGMVRGGSGKGGRPQLDGPKGKKKVMRVQQLETSAVGKRVSSSGKSSGGDVKMISASEVIPLGDGDDF